MIVYTATTIRCLYLIETWYALIVTELGLSARVTIAT